MTKIQKTSKKISPFAGIYFVNDEFIFFTFSTIY
jgi:hypothetical protein